jgi:hypothetical protein
MEEQLLKTSKEWGFEIPERKLAHPLVPMAEIGKPIPTYAHKNIPHPTYMANLNTDTETHAMSTEPLSKHGQKKTTRRFNHGVQRLLFLGAMV